MNPESKKARAELQLKWDDAKWNFLKARAEMVKVQQEIRIAGFKIHPHTGRLNNKKRSI